MAQGNNPVCLKEVSQQMDSQVVFHVDNEMN